MPFDFDSASLIVLNEDLFILRTTRKMISAGGLLGRSGLLGSARKGLLCRGWLQLGIGGSKERTYVPRVLGMRGIALERGGLARACQSCAKSPTLYQSNVLPAAFERTVAPVSGPSAVTGGVSGTATASATAFGTAAAASGLVDATAADDNLGVGSAAGRGAAAKELGASDGWKTK